MTTVGRGLAARSGQGLCAAAAATTAANISFRILLLLLVAGMGVCRSAHPSLAFALRRSDAATFIGRPERIAGRGLAGNATTSAGTVAPVAVLGVTVILSGRNVAAADGTAAALAHAGNPRLLESAPTRSAATRWTRATLRSDVTRAGRRPDQQRHGPTCEGRKSASSADRADAHRICDANLSGVMAAHPARAACCAAASIPHRERRERAGSDSAEQLGLSERWISDRAGSVVWAATLPIATLGGFVRDGRRCRRERRAPTRHRLASHLPATATTA